jgi:hypothetical protein
VSRQSRDRYYFGRPPVFYQSSMPAPKKAATHFAFVTSSENAKQLGRWCNRIAASTFERRQMGS